MAKRFVFIAVFAILGLFLVGEKAQATHMMGSDITWECMGKDSFLITLTIYRDCNGVNLSSASIPVKCKNGSSLTTVSIPLPTPTDITPTCGSSCTRCQTRACAFPYGIEQYKFQKLVYLGNNIPSSCCEIIFSYSMCCRNTSITTGAASQNFYIEASLNRCVNPCDNSPRFTNPPIAIICIGQDFIFNHGLVDKDVDPVNGGLLDSISYEWSYPLSGSGANIAYTGKYDYNKPIYFWGFPNDKLPFPRGFHLDKVTGDISFRPMKAEQTVMALTIKEWRYDSTKGKKVLIGTIRRDIQIIVINCPNNHAPQLSGPYYKDVCAKSTVSFSIRTNDYDTKDTLRIGWNAAIPGARWTDNNGKVKHPTGVMTWTPGEEYVSNIPYVFTVTVKDDACPVNGSSTRAYQILVKPLPRAKISVIDSGCGNYWMFAKPIVGANPTYFWVGNFNPGFVSNSKWVHYKFRRPGLYPYSMTMTAKQCQRTYYDTIEVDTFLQVQNIPDFDNCYGDSVILNMQYLYNEGPASFQWFKGYKDSNSYSEIPGDTHQSKRFVIYQDTQFVYKVMDTIGCWDKDTVHINMHMQPQVDAGKDIRLCSYGTMFREMQVVYDEADKDSVYWKLANGPVLSPTTSITLNDSGTYVAYVKDTIGCFATDTVDVVVSPELIAFANGATICLGDTAELTANETGSKTFNVEYYWYLGTNLMGTGRKIRLTPKVSVSYKLLVLEKINGVECRDSMNVFVKVNPLPEISFSKVDERCISGLNSTFLKMNDYITTNPINAQKQWSFWPLPNAIQVDRFNHMLTGIGTHIVTVKVTDPFTQCVNYDSTKVKINPLPAAIAGPDDTICTGDGSIALQGYPETPPGEWLNYGGHKGVEGNTGNWSFNPTAQGVSNGGSHGIIYSYTNADGCQNFDTAYIVVFETPNTNAGVYDDLCINDGVVDLNKGTPVNGSDNKGNAIPGVWKGPGVSSNSPYSFDPQVTGAGKFDLTYTVSNALCKVSDVTSITVHDLPKLTTDTDDGLRTYCSNHGFVQLIGNGNPTGGTGKWSGTSVTGNFFNTKIITSSETQRETPFTLQYEYTDPYGCKNQTDMTLKVRTEPTIYIDENIKSVCFPDPFTAIAVSTNTDGVKWDLIPNLAFGSFLDGIDDQNTVKYVPNQQDLTNLEFSIMVKSVLNDNVCPDVYDTILIPMSSIPTPAFEMDPKAGCAPHTVTFVDSSTIMAGTITDWTWEFGDGNKSTDQNTSYIYTDPGTYKVTMTAISNAGCQNSVQKEVIVYTVPSAGFIPDPEKVALSTPNILFNNTTKYNVNEGINYTWNFGDASSGSKNTSNEKNPQHRYSDTGTYNVTLYAVSDYGCDSTFIRPIEILPDVRAFIPSAFSPDGLGVVENDTFRVSCDGIAEFHLQIFSRWGELLYESNDYQSHGWTGTYLNSDAKVPLGVYVYILRVKGQEGADYKYSGTVTLVR